MVEAAQGLQRPVYNSPLRKRFRNFCICRNQNGNYAFSAPQATRFWLWGAERDAALQHYMLGTKSGKKGETPTMTKRDTATAAAKLGRPAMPDPLGPNSEIGRKLKQYYDELVSDEVPDRFAALLSQLESAEPARKKD